MPVHRTTLVWLGLGVFWLGGLQQPVPAAEPEPAEKDPLVTLNQAFRKAYASHRKVVLEKTTPIIVVNSDVLVLHRDGKRTEVKLNFSRYDELKSIAHVPL